MKFFMIFGFIVVSVLGDYCYEHITQNCHYEKQDRYCQCEDGWGGDGCCDQQSNTTPTVWSVMGGIVLIILFLLCICRKRIKRYCYPPLPQEQTANYTVNIYIHQQQGNAQQVPQYSQIQPQLVNLVPVLENDLKQSQKQQVPQKFKPLSEAEKKQIMSQDCAICLQKLTEDVRATPCRHVFHRKCIEQVLLHQKQCPLDRLDLQLSQLIKII